MDDSNQEKKDTISPGSLPDIVAKPLPMNSQQRETVRIQLPPRPPAPAAGPTPVVSPSRATPAPVAVGPAAEPMVSRPQRANTPIGVMPQLKKETARIPLVPEPPSKPLPAIQMKKTQPLIPMPQAETQNAPISVAPVTESPTISIQLCWTLLGVSAIVLIIQIWIYFS